MKALSAILILLSLFSIAKAQDSIRTINGKVIRGTIKKVSPYEVGYIRYKSPAAKHNNSSNPYGRISTSEITEIIYANGRHDSVLPALKQVNDTGSRYFTPQDFYKLGENDARLYFRRYKGATTGTFLATFPGSPALGLCVAIATSVTKPSPRLFTYPNADLLDNTDYKQGYAKKAHQMKAGKVWANWSVGTVITFFVFLLLTSGAK